MSQRHLIADVFGFSLFYCGENTEGAAIDWKPLPVL